MYYLGLKKGSNYTILALYREGDVFFFFIFFIGKKQLYSVMQSGGNSLWEDVVLHSFKQAYRDEDNILDQIY